MCNLKKCFNEWLDFENCNKKRLWWGVVFLIGGLFFVALKWINSRWINPSWVIGWSGIGIGAGLINRRIKNNKEGKRDNQNLHYVLYFGFALFVSSLASFALARENGILDLPLSALIGLTIGFSSEKLQELASIR